MIKLALIGGDVSQSKSAPIHQYILGEFGIDCKYEHISAATENFKESVMRLIDNYCGFNVTKPYKEKIIPFMDELCGAAWSVKSVNTVKCGEKTLGYSTDGDGFTAMLNSEDIEYAGKKILMLGSGGAARSCIYPLIKSGAEVEVYNRTVDNAIKMREEIGGFIVLKELSLDKKYDIIINTTSVGMGKAADESLVRANIIENCAAAVDLIYNPRETLFLKTAKSLGKKTLNGAKMLFFQAYYSDCIFIGKQSDKNEGTLLYKNFERKAIL